MIKWISVKDRLPDLNVDVVVFNGVFGYGRVTEWGWHNASFKSDSQDILQYVTHWQPLPPPPLEFNSDEEDGLMEKGQPVYVSDRSDRDAILSKRERIFLADVGGATPFVCADDLDDGYESSCWRFAVAVED